MTRHGTRQVLTVAALVLVMVSVVRAHNIEIKFYPGNAGADGTVKFKFKLDGTNAVGLPSLDFKVKDGDSAATMAGNLAFYINSTPSINVAYFAMTGTEKVGNVTLQTVTIFPEPPNEGQDFTGGSSSSDFKDDPKVPGIGFKVIAAAPGNTSLQLKPGALPNPALAIDWNLFVVSQNGNVDGSVALTGIPDTTSANALIGMFDSGLMSQGIPVVANGNTLSLTTSDNDFFVVGESTGGSLYPSVSDTLIPEPATLTLFGSGMLGLLMTARRRVAGSRIP